MSKLLIKNAKLVNEGRTFESDLLIQGERIAKIAPGISADGSETIVDANGKLLIPGMIDDQVHFREPGFPDKGTIASESRAAVAGGTTTYMEMPNVSPPTTSLQALEDKYARAAKSSLANHAFYLGATNDNIEEIRRLDPKAACGVKIFMGASTGNMLVDNLDTLNQIFADCPVLIATHCEDTPTIQANEAKAREKYGEHVPMREHANIRSGEACYKSSSLAVELAKKHGSKLHVIHITTKEELKQFEAAKTLDELAKKQISSEACVHHLFFNESDYEQLGGQIRCNPSIKTKADQEALLQAVNEGVIDIIATDHAPHTWQEKQEKNYFKVPSGLPLVQHALQIALEFYHQNTFSLETIVQKTSHAPAVRYRIKDRGFIREGYYADLALIDLHQPQTISKSNLFYRCGWSPFENHTFRSSIDTTIINGEIKFRQGKIMSDSIGKRLEFDR
jgi:dihydroorotase